MSLLRTPKVSASCIRIQKRALLTEETSYWYTAMGALHGEEMEPGRLTGFRLPPRNPRFQGVLALFRQRRR
jgi:hypothetical protein